MKHWSLLDQIAYLEAVHKAYVRAIAEATRVARVKEFFYVTPHTRFLTTYSVNTYVAKHVPPKHYPSGCAPRRQPNQRL